MDVVPAGAKTTTTANAESDLWGGRLVSVQLHNVARLFATGAALWLCTVPVIVLTAWLYCDVLSDWQAAGWDVARESPGREEVLFRADTVGVVWALMLLVSYAAVAEPTSRSFRAVHRCAPRRLRVAETAMVVLPFAGNWLGTRALALQAAGVGMGTFCGSMLGVAGLWLAVRGAHPSVRAMPLVSLMMSLMGGLAYLFTVLPWALEGSDARRVAMRVATPLLIDLLTFPVRQAARAAEPRARCTLVSLELLARAPILVSARQMIFFIADPWAASLCVLLVSVTEPLLRLTVTRRDRLLHRLLRGRNFSGGAGDVMAQSVCLDEASEVFATLASASILAAMRASNSAAAPRLSSLLASALLQLLAESAGDLVPAMALANRRGRVPDAVRRAVGRRRDALAKWGRAQHVRMAAYAVITVIACHGYQFAPWRRVFCGWSADERGWWHTVQCSRVGSLEAEAIDWQRP